MMRPARSRLGTLLTLTAAACSGQTPPSRAATAAVEARPGAIARTTAAPIAPETMDSAPTEPLRASAVSDAGALVASATGDAAAPAMPVVASPALYFDRDIAPSELQGRTLRELAILRNMPYARRGHTFRRPWLATYFGAQDWYHPTRVVADSELSPVDRRNADAVAGYDAALDRAALQQLRDALLARDRAHQLRPGDEVEAVLLSARLGARIALASVDSTVPRDSSPLDEPARLDALLTVAELRRLSPRDLRILRFMVYARRGRPFRAHTLQSYFETTEWYAPDQAYNDARLRRVDRQNIRVIQSVEAELGGPITEQQARDEDDSFAGA